ncbi:MAG: hypothetical protein CL674_15475 [Bdellovibrionaceae bacterium]|nr:hypothetical protein [Pseudobdellovibrionaceae bacterium]
MLEEEALEEEEYLEDEELEDDEDFEDDADIESEDEEEAEDDEDEDLDDEEEPEEELSELEIAKMKLEEVLGSDDLEKKLDSMSFDELAALDPEAFDEDDEDEVVLTDAEGRAYCRVKDCDELATVDGYCRFHYLVLWKRIQVRKKILAGGKLDRYIEELTARYPDKYLEMLRKDLATEKDFMAVVHDLEIEDGNVEGDFDEDDKEYIDEVRGIGGSGSGDDDSDY